MTTALLHKYAEPDAEGMSRLREAITKMNMSARAYDRILKVARTIADLDASVAVRQPHIMEAIAAAATSTAATTSTCNVFNLDIIIIAIHISPDS